MFILHISYPKARQITQENAQGKINESKLNIFMLTDLFFFF